MSATMLAVLRKWQECSKLDSILRTERNRSHGYPQPFHMASLPSRDYLTLCPLVPAVSTQIPRSGGDDTRTGPTRRSHQDLTLGPVLCSWVGEALPTPSQGYNRFLARRRNLCEGEKGVDVPLSSSGLAISNTPSSCSAQHVMRQQPSSFSRRRWEQLIRSLLG
jgi:hypothetical protein